MVCGSGGTGKTTIAAALGARAAVLMSGRVLVLTVDPAAQTAAFDGLAALGEGTEGAVVALEPSTGKILAMVSSPSAPLAPGIARASRTAPANCE